VALPQRKAIDFALQTAHGLAAAHEKGIVHRDLKPENLFITKDGRVKSLILVWRSYLATIQTRLRQKYQQGESIRIQAWSWERLATCRLSSSRASCRSSIRHLLFGAILYEMLSGRRAFRGESNSRHDERNSP
jgi:serine/threonine protein kinase